MMKKILVLLISATLSCNVGFGITTPHPSRYDNRIQMINYNSNDVIKLYGVPGVATQITLEEDENYITHAFGDPKAWDFTHAGSHVFIKPKAENGDTNLIIVTSKRTYNFELHYLAKADQLTTYQLSFRFPEEIKAHLTDVANQKAIERDFKQRAGQINLDYLMTKDPKSASIAPTHVWDDGRFTYFEFPGNRDLPTIYVVNPDGTEAMVNRYNKGVDNNTTVLEKVAKRWVIRLDNQVIGVINNQFDPEGIANASATRSPAVIRVVKRGAP